MSLINFVPYLLNDFGSPKSSSVFHREAFDRSLYPAYDEDDKEIRFSVDMPGVRASDVDVTFKDGLVSVSGERRTKSVDGKTVKRARYAQSFTLDEESADVSKLKANLSDGVLVMAVPKKPKQAPTKIAVTAEPHAGEIEAAKESGSDSAPTET